LLEKAMASGKGFEVNSDKSFRQDAYWFGESQSRVVVSVSADKAAAFAQFMATQQTPATLLGAVKGSNLVVNAENWGTVSDWKVNYDNVLHGILEA